MTKSNPSYFLVIGLGASGLSMAKFLHSKGEHVIATDIDASRTEAEEQLQALGIQTQIGFHDQETFNRAGIMIPSPGIPLTNTYIRTASTKGVAIQGELDIFSAYNSLPIIAITGTNGKTTTTSLIGQMLTSCGMAPFVGGNIGTPLVDQLMDKIDCDIIVAEVSSFQLDLSSRFKPDVGILLNISHDHLDRYENYHAYETSKWRIFKKQSHSDTAIINPSINGFGRRTQKLSSTIFTFSSGKNDSDHWGARIGTSEIKLNMPHNQMTIETGKFKALQGRHNQENMAAAILACLSVGADVNGLIKGLETFKTLSHRVEFVKEINGVRFYNDSKATNTDAVICAINCFEHNIILILGGREKGTDFSQLLEHVQKSVKTIIAIGESTRHINETFINICQVFNAQSMKDAVRTAHDIAVTGDTVLLSPACASFDMYENYSQRGEDFITHVTAIGNEHHG